MEIILDGQPLDVTLEHERKLGDVLASLSRWIDSQGGLFTAIRINGELYSEEKSSKWENFPLERLDKIELTSQPLWQKDLDELKVLEEYFDLLENYLDLGDKNALQEVFAEYPYVRGNLFHHLRDLLGNLPEGGTSILDRFAEAIESTPGLFLPPETLPAALEYVRTLQKILSGRIKELTDPEDEARAVILRLKGTKAEMEQVALLLQTGKDAEAMQYIITCTEYILKALRLLVLAPKSEDIKSFRDELNSVLLELKEAFTVKDSVLIGDLMEYEIAPKTERLAALLSEKVLKESEA